MQQHGDKGGAGKGKPPARLQPPRTVLMLLLAFGLVWLVVLFLRAPMGQTKEFTQTQFYKHLAEGKVKSVVVTESSAKVELHSAVDDVKSYEFDIGNDQIAAQLVDNLKAYNEESSTKVDYSYKNPNALLRFVVAVVAPTAILLILLYFIFFRSMNRAGGSGVLSFGKSRARMAVKGQVKVTFDDVAGVEEAKEDVKEIVEFLRNEEKFRKVGARVPRGVLLVGAPGTGKTLLAKAIAGEADVPFYSISGSDFVEMFVGVGASRVRDLFRQAKETAPCIIFLDEIDAVGRKRGTSFSGGGHDEREQTLNAILVEMDGFESDQNVIVIAATNRPDVLDPALRRPGRFDRQIMVDMPDVKGREEILNVHAKKVKLDETVELSMVARGTPMFTGADLEAVINEAAILAALAGRLTVSMADMEEARDKVLWGRQRRSRVMALEDKRITAYHESGHAVATKLLPEVEPLHKVTIVPRGMALGATMQLPERDKYHVQRKEILGEIVSLLSGRVAEEMFCTDISSGAREDIRRATGLARSMVREWGMSEKMGPIYYGDEESVGAFDVIPTRPYSESMAVEIDGEVKRILSECYERAKKLLAEHREDLSRVAEALLEREVLDNDEVDRIIAGEKLAPQEAPAEENGKEEPQGEAIDTEVEATDTEEEGEKGPDKTEGE